MSRSTILSAGLVLLAACDTPDILVQVTRPSSTLSLSITVCGAATCNVPRQIFGAADPLSRSVGIYRHDSTSPLRLEFQQGSGAGQHCDSIDVPLEGGGLELSAELQTGAAIMRVDCAPDRCTEPIICPDRVE